MPTTDHQTIDHKTTTIRRPRPSSSNGYFQTTDHKHNIPENRPQSSTTLPLSDIDHSFALDPEFSFLLNLPATFFDPGNTSPPQTPFSPYSVLPSIESIDSAQHSIRRSANFQANRAKYEEPRDSSHDLLGTIWEDKQVTHVVCHVMCRRLDVLIFIFIFYIFIFYIFI